MAKMLKVIGILTLLVILVVDAFPLPKFPIPLAFGDITTKPHFETNSLGEWALINRDSGVSAMHINLMPSNKIIVYDANVYRTSRLKFQDGHCVTYTDTATNTLKQDCFAHSMEYDIATNKVKPHPLAADPWCSSGGLAPDGTLISTGGWFDGAKTVRYMSNRCPNNNSCHWREYNNALIDERWYGTQTLLENGESIVIGGRKSYSYEFVPKEGHTSTRSYNFPFLYETSDIDENNLYPFVHLSVDNNLFVFANNRSLLLNPTNNKVVRTFPVLPGGSRTYPASGNSALLPIRLDLRPSDGANNIKVEVIVCGGNSPDAFNLAETRKIFLPALQDCGRMVITDPNPTWDIEQMPSRRTMGDALILPNGQILFINGAQNGTAAWWDADVPNLTPALYTIEKPKGQRFKVMNPTAIARMYHSSSAVLPSGKVWVGGSNTHNTYKDVDKFPTETRVEAFSPPYLDKSVDQYRPKIILTATNKRLKYGSKFGMQFSLPLLNGENQVVGKREIKATMYFPPFTTHGFSMNQRLVVLKTLKVIPKSDGIFRLRLEAPPFAAVAPPGHYLLFVVHRGVPSTGIWVNIS